MTQTTPSHSQSVEAEPIAIVNKATCISVHRGNEVLANFAGPESHANARLFASALASQQEVAAPVGDDEDDAALSLRHHIQYCDRNIAAWREKGNEEQVLWWENWKAEVERRELAASRVPVASLASREQGVEAVGTMPGKWVACTPELLLAGVSCADTPRRPGGESHSHDHFIAHTAPPSSKTQDDLAGTNTWTPEEIEAVICCLDDDASAMLNENDEDERAHNMQRAATMIQVFSDLASRSKAPAPVPVVQWEARIGQLGKVSAALIRLDAIYRDLVDTEVTPDRPTWLRDALHIAEALATPANMAVGAGDVEAAYDWEAEALLQRERITRIANALRPDMGSFAFEDVIQAVEKILIARRTAPEQATTGSGQGVTDAVRLDFMTANRMAVMPEYEGPWEAQTYPDDATEPVVTAHGDTPREAIDAAILSTASPAGEGEGKS